MIVGVGFDLIDLVDFGRTLKRSGQPFVKRVFTEKEINYCVAQPHSTQSFAVRFAAKEATMKALGIAGEDGLQWRDFEVVLASSGHPVMTLHGKASIKAKSLGVGQLFVTLSHSASVAGAVVIAQVSMTPQRPIGPVGNATTSTRKTRSE